LDRRAEGPGDREEIIQGCFECFGLKAGDAVWRNGRTWEMTS